MLIFSLVLLGSLLSVGAASAQFGQPKPVTEEADSLHTLYLLVTVAGFIVFALVTGALLYMVVRYRRRSDELPPQTHGNNLLEVIWTTIPIVIVLFLFVSSFVVLLDVEEDAEPEDLTVNVTGFQFSWEFVYDLADLGRGEGPGGEGTVSVIGTGSEEPLLVIPVNEPVEFKLTSNDVIHSFYVRNFLYKLDVVPGLDNSFKVTAHETGTFEAQCAELCGLDHALMRFQVQVMERPDFDAYIAGLASEQLEQARVP
ncbi:MAG: cytochrome c oxidase subunit II [Dehalococcoidia bacterium]|nr:cytochrome c oxidase subunit II [Dehalococcoidia bacterium]